MHSKIYNNYYLYIYNKSNDKFSSSFIIGESDEGYINMQMTWDLQFSLIAKHGDREKFKIYVLPVNKFERKKHKYKRVLKFKINIFPNEHHRIYQEYENFSVNFWTKNMNNKEIYMSNPCIRIKKEYLDKLLH